MTDIRGGLESALVEATTSLDAAAIPYMLIGGLALAAWDLPRATLDVDLTVWVTAERFEGVCLALAREFIPRVNDPLSFAKKARVLPVTTSDGVRIDIVFAAFPFEEVMIHRAVSRRFGKQSVQVASLEDLVLLKAVSPRSKDQQDIQLIIKSYRGKLDWDYLLKIAEELAEALEKPGIAEELRRLRQG